MTNRELAIWVFGYVLGLVIGILLFGGWHA